MYDALLKYKDVYDISKRNLKYSEILEDMKIDEKNLKDLERESIRKYNESFS